VPGAKSAIPGTKLCSVSRARDYTSRAHHACVVTLLLLLLLLQSVHVGDAAPDVDSSKESQSPSFTLSSSTSGKALCIPLTVDKASTQKLQILHLLHLLLDGYRNSSKKAIFSNTATLAQCFKWFNVFV
jgi:hypothetical protein